MKTVDRKTYHHGSLRAALMDAAERTLEDRGVDALSLRDLARQLGVSPNAPYRHFRDRESLLAAMAARGFGELADALEKPKSGRFTDVGDAYMDFARTRPAVFRLMFGGRIGSFLPYPELVEQSNRAFQVLLQACARQLPPNATQPDRAMAAISVWSLVHGYAVLRQDGAIPCELAPADLSARQLSAWIRLVTGAERNVMP